MSSADLIKAGSWWTYNAAPHQRYQVLEDAAKSTMKDLAHGEAWKTCVIYRNPSGQVFVRPANQFMDKFTQVKQL